MLPSLFLAALPLVAAAPWAQPDDSPVYELFKRQSTGKYPPALAVPPVEGIPKEWLAKLELVKGNISNVDVSKPLNTTDGNAVEYPKKPSEADLQKPQPYCAFTTGCVTSEDITGGPAGTFMITFDDGPGDGTTMLSDFLNDRNMSTHATHFMIGANIVEKPDLFKNVFDRGGHIASHTWSHPRLTTLTNEQIVGELGWTMQAIADNTGGRLPLYWRPPYGDLDNRVRDVANKVFGLKTVLWNKDSSDWKIASGDKKTTESEFDAWVNLPKTTGINGLMHEIHVGTVEIFMAKFQNFINAGWKIASVAEAYNTSMYFNAVDNKAPVQTMSINDLGAKPPVAANTSAPANGGAGSSATTTGGTASTPSATTTGSGAKGLVTPLATVLLASVFAALF